MGHLSVIIGLVFHCSSWTKVSCPALIPCRTSTARSKAARQLSCSFSTACANSASLICNQDSRWINCCTRKQLLAYISVNESVRVGTWSLRGKWPRNLRQYSARCEPVLDRFIREPSQNQITQMMTDEYLGHLFSMFNIDSYLRIRVLDLLPPVDPNSEPVVSE